MKTVGQYIGFGLALAVGCASVALAYMVGRETGRSELSVTEAENALIRQSVGVVVPIEDDSLTTADIAAFDREIWNLVSAGQALEDLRETHASTVEALDTAREQAADQSELAAMAARVAELQNVLQDRNDEVDRLSSLENSAAQLTSTQSELARTRSLASSKDATINALRRQLDTTYRRLEDAERRLEVLAGNEETITLSVSELYSDPARGVEFVVLGADYRGTHIRQGGRSHFISISDTLRVSEECSITYIARDPPRYRFRLQCS